MRLKSSIVALTLITQIARMIVKAKRVDKSTNAIVVNVIIALTKGIMKKKGSKSTVIRYGQVSNCLRLKKMSDNIEMNP